MKTAFKEKKTYVEESKQINLCSNEIVSKFSHDLINV